MSKINYDLVFNELVKGLVYDDQNTLFRQLVQARSIQMFSGVGNGFFDWAAKKAKEFKHPLKIRSNCNRNVSLNYLDGEEYFFEDVIENKTNINLSKCDFMVTVGRDDVIDLYLNSIETHPDLVIINVM